MNLTGAWAAAGAASGAVSGGMEAWSRAALGVSALFAAATPACHAVACRMLLGRSATWYSVVVLPLLGGSRHLTLQVVSWAMWASSLLVACPLVLARWHEGLGDLASSPHLLQVLSVSAAIGSVCSLLFLLQSLMVFAPQQRTKLQEAAKNLGRGQMEIALDVSRLPSRWTSYYLICGMGMLWALMALSMLLATEFVGDAAARLGYYVLAAVCGTAGTFSTYGLAGHLRWAINHPGADGASSGSDGEGEGSGPGRRGGRSPSKAASPTGKRQQRAALAVRASGDDLATAAQLQQELGWRFFQPLRGGGAFVAIQAFGWTLYSAALVGVIYLFWQGLLGTAAVVAASLRAWLLATGAAMFAAQVVLLISLTAYKGPGMVHGLTAGWSLKELRRKAEGMVIICALYIQVHLFAASVVLTYVALPPQTATLLWAGLLFLYYSLTSFGQPEHTGRRAWPALQDWVSQRIEGVIRDWLGSFEFRKARGAKFDAKEKYIFGYVPHGLYPIYAGLLPLMPSWRAALPGLRAVTLCASVIYVPPVLRDIVCWLGGRVVGRRTFVHTLRERGAVIVVPGGQAELCMMHYLHSKGQVVVYSGHKGFVRLAIQEQAHLVPLVAFGEADSLHNLMDIPWLQRLTYKAIGFPVPFILTGWRGLPLPAPTGMRFVIGQPIPPPPLPRGGGTPRQEDVDAFHRQFYDATARLWEQHRRGFPGYESKELLLTDRHL